MTRAVIEKILLKFISIRFLLLVTGMSFTISVIWIQFTIMKYLSDSDMVPEAIQNIAKDFRYTEVHIKAGRLPKNLKYILRWASGETAPLKFLGTGQKKFIENNCSHINCYVTRNQYFFKGDTTNFDAIVFNGPSITNNDLFVIPNNRSFYQTFIYFNMESADYYPVCSEYYDEFFNWTATYRLDSDIPLPYIQVRDVKEKIIGPKRSMKWLDLSILNDEKLEVQMQNKTKAVAWFTSHCSTRSRREDYVTELKKALHPFGFSVDIYGESGLLKCPRMNNDVCFSLLEKEYYFYLSFESSFAEDYITHKILYPVQHNSVTIVLGGANYSRFLPPGSYISAGKMTPEDLASKIVRVMKNTKYYSSSILGHKDPSVTDNVCAVCEALNDMIL